MNPRWHRTLASATAVSALATTLAIGVSFAQEDGPPLPSEAPAPAEVAALRARFQGMTAQEAQAAGYQPTPCVSAAGAGLPPKFGAMGQHFINGPLYERQSKNGADPATPPVLLVDGTGLVVGAEWEIGQSVQPAPNLFGIDIPLQPGHEGAPEPHYMLHIYVRPNGKVVMAPPNPIPFEPEISCTPAPATDGRTLAGESRATRELFVGTWGDQAAGRWANEHSAQLAAGR